MKGSTDGREAQRVNFHTKCCDVFFFKLSGQMSLDEGSLDISQWLVGESFNGRRKDGRNTPSGDFGYSV